MSNTEQILAGLVGGVGRGLSSYVDQRNLLKQRQQEAYEAAMRQRLVELQTQNMEQDIEWQGKTRAWETPQREAEAAYYRPEMIGGGLGKLGIGVPMSQYSVDQQLERQARQQLAEFNVGKQGHEQRMWPLDEGAAGALGTQRETSAEANRARAWRTRNQPFAKPGGAGGAGAIKEMTLQQLQSYSNTVQQNIDDLTGTLDYYDPGDAEYESKAADLEYWNSQKEYVRAEVAAKQGTGGGPVDQTAEQIANLQASGLSKKEARKLLNQNRAAWAKKYDIKRLTAAVEALK